MSDAGITLNFLASYLATVIDNAMVELVSPELTWHNSAIMARRRNYSRRQAKPQELIVATAIIGVLFLASSAASFPKDALPQLIIIVIGFILLGIIGYYYFVYKKLMARRQALRELQIIDVDGMSGVAFEEYVAELFRRQGYTIQTTALSGDYGVDLIVKKDGIRSAIQTKRYSKPVNQAAVREAVAGMMHHKCSQSIVVTNNYFTKFAVELARSNNCRLVDRDKLIEVIAYLLVHDD